jgi:glutamyl-tRNA(Gln) amidotransferase subunit E
MEAKHMEDNFNAMGNYLETKERIGYLPRKETPPEIYEKLGLMCGLEVHQQLKTEKKLFCHCPAGVFQKDGQYEAEVIRHMRPTLSEMGGYDGTALMEFKTKKTIVYRIANVTTCTYDVDDTPPFIINQEALKSAIEVALLLKTNIVGELHITRKQYLDGSIPTGFQRTGIISIEGQIPLKNKTVGIIQLSLEEDSCREVSDIGHMRVYTTDRLGMPLIETVTYPDMKTPSEAAEAAYYIRFLNRSTGKVRTGIGAAREDVNVSITGGTRIEIKGVSHIKLIPELVHNEAFRQRSLLEIKEELSRRVPDKKGWRISHKILNSDTISTNIESVKNAIDKDYTLCAVNLPSFKGLLSFFTQPGRSFQEEICDRLKVIACIEKPNLVSSENMDGNTEPELFSHIRRLLHSREGDAQLLIWGPQEDIKTALETIEERCLMAFEGIPNETRKALENGTTMFERVLPGADRMYPDTDSAPISISQELIDGIKGSLPVDVDKRMSQLKRWGVPEDAYTYILRNNLVPLMERIYDNLKIEPKYCGVLLGHRLKYLQGHIVPASEFDYEKIYELFDYTIKNNINPEIVYDLLPILYSHPKMDMVSVFETYGFKRCSREKISSYIPFLQSKFKSIAASNDKDADFRWMMKELRKISIGNMPMEELAEIVHKGGLGK